MLFNRKQAHDSRLVPKQLPSGRFSYAPPKIRLELGVALMTTEELRAYIDKVSCIQN